MEGPDFLTNEETKELADIIELQIDTAIEEKHIHEIAPEDETDRGDVGVDSD